MYSQEHLDAIYRDIESGGLEAYTGPKWWMLGLQWPRFDSIERQLSSIYQLGHYGNLSTIPFLIDLLHEETVSSKHVCAYYNGGNNSSTFYRFPNANKVLGLKLDYQAGCGLEPELEPPNETKLVCKVIQEAVNSLERSYGTPEARLFRSVHAS